jgi:hypothetical protein
MKFDIKYIVGFALILFSQELKRSFMWVYNQELIFKVM